MFAFTDTRFSFCAGSRAAGSVLPTLTTCVDVTGPQGDASWLRIDCPEGVTETAPDLKRRKKLNYDRERRCRKSVGLPTSSRAAVPATAKSRQAVHRTSLKADPAKAKRRAAQQVAKQATYRSSLQNDPAKAHRRAAQNSSRQSAYHSSLQNDPAKAKRRAAQQVAGQAAYRSSLQKDPAKAARRDEQLVSSQEDYVGSLETTPAKGARRRRYNAAAGERHRLKQALLEAVEIAVARVEADERRRETHDATPARLDARAQEVAWQAANAASSDQFVQQADPPQRYLSTAWDRELHAALSDEPPPLLPTDAAWCNDQAARVRWTAIRRHSARLMSIPLDNVCNTCNESWPNMEMAPSTPGLCLRCHKLKPAKKHKFALANNMDPGDVPSHLPSLSVPEEALIGVAHQHIHVMRNTGGSSKYRGHTCVFEQQLGTFLTSLPPKVRELNILLVRQEGDTGYPDRIFRVRRHAVHAWLTFLIAHNPAYKHVTLNGSNLADLPDNACVGHDLPQVVQRNEVPSAAAVPGAGIPSGPAAAAALPPDDSGVISVKPIALEDNALLNTLRRAQRGDVEDDPQRPLEAVAYPHHNSAIPLNEFTNPLLLAGLYPVLYPTGRAMFIDPTRTSTVTFKQYVLHMLRHKSRRFAQHPRWRYTMLNQQMRWEAMSLSRAFVDRQYQHLTVDELARQVERGNTSVIRGLQRFSNPLTGTDSFWSAAKARGYAFLTFNEYFFDRMPTYFGTISAAELHWRWFHRMLPGSDDYLQHPVESSSEEYRLRAEAVAKNPSLSAWAFHHMATSWIKEVLYKHCGWVDHLLRYEFSQRGMTHAHFLAQLLGAPTISELEDAFAEQATRTAANDDSHGPKMLAIIARFRSLVQLTAYHPEPLRRKWKVKPSAGNWPTEGELTEEQVRAAPAITTPLCQVRDDPTSMRDHLAQLTNRTMLHVCGAYCLRKDPASKEMFCRGGFGEKSMLRTACDCAAHERVWCARTAEDALANADPAPCPSCAGHPLPPPPPPPPPPFAAAAAAPPAPAPPAPRQQQASPTELSAALIQLVGAARAAQWEADPSVPLRDTDLHENHPNCGNASNFCSECSSPLYPPSPCACST
jgi:hypothetical protein